MGAALVMLAACADTGQAVRPVASLPPGGLVGQPGATLTPYLGEPSLKRSEPPAEIWQYATPDCLLFLFLYRESQGMTVKHLDARDRQRKPVDVDACARKVAAQAVQSAQAGRPGS